MSQLDPKQFQFVDSPRSARSELRSSDVNFHATKHSRGEMFEERVFQTESWLDLPIIQAALLTIGVFTAIGAIVFFWGWWL